MARKLVEEANPGDLKAAIMAVAHFAERSEAYSRLGRSEELMEVGYTSNPPVDADVAGSLRKILQQQEKITTKVAKLEEQQGMAPPGKRGRAGPTRSLRGRNQLPAFDDAGRPRCFQCQRYGHLARDCPTRTTQTPGAGKRVTVIGGKPEGRPMINVTISGTNVTALVDTGASRSLLRDTEKDSELYTSTLPVERDWTPTECMWINVGCARCN